MNREILTYPIERNQIREEFYFFVEYFSKKGFQFCYVLVGSSWGNKYHITTNWDYEKVSFSELLNKVNYLEDKEYGKLGSDDLFIKFDSLPIEFLFCNDSDIHIKFVETTEIVESFYERWKTFGYSPAEWQHDESGKPINRTRMN